MRCFPTALIVRMLRGHDYGSPVGRRVDVGHLVGARTAAERLGLGRVQVLHQLRYTNSSFPEALYWTKRGRGGTGVWYWPDIWRWARVSGRAEFVNGRLSPLRRSSPLLVRRVDVDNLVDGKQMGERLGLQHPRSFHLIANGDPSFPTPVFSSTGRRWGTQLWVWPDIYRWAESRDRPLPVDYKRSHECPEVSGL